MAIPGNTVTKIIAKIVILSKCHTALNTYISGILGSSSFCCCSFPSRSKCYLITISTIGTAYRGMLLQPSLLSFLCFEARAWQGQTRYCCFRWLYGVFLVPPQDLIIIVPYQFMAGSFYFAPIQTVTLVVEEEEAAHCRPPAPPCNTGETNSTILEMRTALLSSMVLR